MKQEVILVSRLWRDQRTRPLPLTDGKGVAAQHPNRQYYHAKTVHGAMVASEAVLRRLPTAVSGSLL